MPARRLLTAFLALTLAAIGLLWLSPRASVADADGVEARTAAAVEEILADADLPSAFWGILVQDLRTGRVVVSRNADKLMLPASTLKLFTTAAALDALGPTYRYTTRLYDLGTVEPDGTFRGDLVIRGAGDPTFGSEGHGDPLSDWARALAAAGIRRVEGRLIGDDDRFADEPYGEGWDISHIATERYAAAAGGLTWADNLLDIKIQGAAAGRPARIESDPPGFATITSDITTRGSGRSGLDVHRTLGTDVFHMTGGVAAGYEGTLEVPAGNPTLYAVHAFAKRLRDAGIDVARATLADADDLRDKPRYDGAEPLRVSVSPTLDRIVYRINRESDNLYAEQVLRTLAPDGSVAGGARVVKAFVSRAGADAEPLSIRDGSGLSRKDLVTPDAMAAVLRAMADHPAAAAFRASLPEGGGARSTLRNRLQGVSVRAKTGSIEYVRCLAGYVDGPGGTPLVFVLMTNNYTVDGGRIVSAQDRIVRALATGQRVPIDEE
jgi:D-alanyl-D-alanine carboxypeptidase/D-alanyl-D-alanine-endopeptidase (penicillin-binding protein 4)